jgi:hypothetical protein
MGMGRSSNSNFIWTFYECRSSFHILSYYQVKFNYNTYNSQNLFPIIALLLNKMGANLEPMDSYPYLDRFSIFYCGIFVGIILFPLLITKHIAFLIKLNSYGVYFVLVSIIFVISNGIYSICTTDFDFEYILNHNKPNVSPRHLYLFGDNPILLAGTLTLSYFSHSFALPMMKNNERQENNKRDLFLGYCLVFGTYVFLGILGYIGFSGEAYDANFKNVMLFLIF